mmetsp:Transcript_253/g.773  ORF Transcript_253/g.773 Transcript_253/m.773 type:complete len:262 (+) Transcript_253:2009-2794(+)
MVVVVVVVVAAMPGPVRLPISSSSSSRPRPLISPGRGPRRFEDAPALGGALEKLGAPLALHLAHHLERRRRVRLEGVPNEKSGRERARVVVREAHKAREIERVWVRPPELVEHRLVLRRLVHNRTVAPIVLVARPLKLARVAPLPFGRANHLLELLQIKLPIAVQVEEVESEAQVRIRARRLETREPNQPLPKVNRPVPVVVEEFHHPLQVNVIHQPESLRQLARIQLAILIRIRLGKKCVRAAQSPFRDQVNVLHRLCAE